MLASPPRARLPRSLSHLAAVGSLVLLVGGGPAVGASPPPPTPPY